MLSGSFATTVRLPTRSSKGREENQLGAPRQVGWGKAETQESTHCRARSSWRRTERRRAQILQTRNSERPRHLSLGLQMQSPDRLSQRRGKGTGAARKESESGQEILLEPTSDTSLPSPAGARTESLTLPISSHSPFLHSTTTLHVSLFSLTPTNPTVIVLGHHNAALPTGLISEKWR